MLEGLKRGKGKSSPEADELRELVATARQEGQALVALTDKLADQAANASLLAQTLARVETAVGEAHKKLDGFQQKLVPVEDSARKVGELDSLVQALTIAIKNANETAARLSAPDGELQKQRQAAQQLSAQALQTRAMVDTLKGDQEALTKLRTDLRATVEDLKSSRDQSAAVAAEVSAVRIAVSDLTKEHTQIRESARESRDDAAAAAAKLQELDQRMAGLGRLQETVRTLDERIVTLNTTSEHVMQKTKVLDLQKHTVERAIIESHRLTGMVMAMEGQIARLDEGRRQAALVEDSVDRIEQIVRESSTHLDEANRGRDALASELNRLGQERTILVEFVGKYEERLAAERRALEASQARSAALEASLEKIERTQESVAARDTHLAAMAERIDSLETQLVTTGERAEDAGRKIEIVEVLKQDLLRVDEMARRATWQMESLKAARTDLEELRSEVQAFYREHADAVQLRDRLSADRVALEGFLDRASEFAVTLPELDARLNAVRSKLSIVDEGTQKATNLVAIADDLDRQMTRLTGYQQFVDRIEGRLNALQSLTTDIDRKIEEQITRRGEIDTLKSLCDGVNIQVTELRQKLGGLTQTQARFLPVVARVASLEKDVEATEARLANALRGEAELGEQERRVGQMLESVRELTTASSARLTQVQGLTEALGRSETIKDGLMQELSVVQGRQREVAGQLETADAQVRHLDTALGQLEERRHQVAFAEKRMTAFESGVATLKAAADEVERRTQDLGKRHDVLDALRSEVQGVRELSAQSKADLDHLEVHRADVLSLRAQVDELLATSRATEDRLAEINARRRVVDEVQLKVNVITTMLDDVRLTLETVGTQRAVLDHALNDLAKFEVVVQQAERTLKSLQNERELAEHIERSIHTLRARTTVADDKKRA